LPGSAGQLTDKERTLKKPGDDFLLGKPNMTEAQRERYRKLQELLNPDSSKDEEVPPPPPSRRWHTGWSRKRRWKS
jgi:hypothetical protein